MEGQVSELKSYFFKVYLVESIDSMKDIFTILIIEENYLKETLFNFRTRIHNLFKNSFVDLKLESEPKYHIYLEDGTELDLRKNLNFYLEQQKEKTNKNPDIYFSTFSSADFMLNNIKINKTNEEIKKELEEQKILKELKNSLTEENTFDKIITPTYQELINSKPELKFKSYILNFEELLNLKSEINKFKIKLKLLPFITESDREHITSNILESALYSIKANNICKNIFLSLQFPIEPTFKYQPTAGISRKADVIIFEINMVKMICISVIKKKGSDIMEAVMKNADQLRAYCLCYKRKIGRGIATTADEWIFTEFNRETNRFKISPLFKFLENETIQGFFYRIKEDYVEFFQNLIGFIMESISIMNNN